MKDVLIKIAYDDDRNVVFANNAVKGKKYYCPKCGQELIFKNSGKTGPGTRCPHFAHKGGGGHNCDPESVLHAAFKKETAKLLSECIKENKAFNIKWVCGDCGSQYTGNLLFVAKTVELEYDLNVCRPDIALLDETGRVRIAIEIVKTHEPEENAIGYYRDNGIVLIQYNVAEDDLGRIEEKIGNPDLVTLCLNKCKRFNPLMISRCLVTRSGECESCHRLVTVFLAESTTVLGHVIYNGLNNGDLNDLRSNNIDLNKLRIGNVTDNKGGMYRTYMTKCNCKIGFYYPRPVKRNRRW